MNFHSNDIDEEKKHLDSIVISDTGVGFNSVSFERFGAILDNSKGYHNRGTGRLQFLHRFSQLSIVSQYVEKNESYIRTFKSSNENFIFDERLAQSNSEESLTTITLQGFKSQKKDDEYFSSLTLKKFESLIKSQYAYVYI